MCTASPPTAPFGRSQTGSAIGSGTELEGDRPSGAAAAASPEGDVELFVVGAHLRGQPLNGQLVGLGARFVTETTTAAAYRLVALDTVPPKPGLVRHGAGLGAPIAGELWRLPVAGLGRFLAALPPPMSLTPVELSDGRYVVGFGCAADAAAAGVDITAYGGWRAYLASR